jgi:hypothetical protein
MAHTPPEPSNLVLEQLRAMRAQFDRMEADISDIKKDIRGMKLNTIAEIDKANLTVASFVDHEQRIQALERKSP